MDIATAEKLCTCPMCPTYLDCGERPAFCMEEIGKSKCIEVESGCICPACPVQEALSFQHEYYCIRGSEKELLAG